MITLHFLQPDSPMPMNGMVCYINASNFQAQCLLQYWQRGKSLWIFHFDMPDDLIQDSMSKIKLGINFSGPKPLSEDAQKWVMSQPVHIPVFVQIIDAMAETNTSIKELAEAVDLREATISDFLKQKSEMTSGNVDKIFQYLILKQ